MIWWFRIEFLDSSNFQVSGNFLSILFQCVNLQLHALASDFFFQLSLLSYLILIKNGLFWIYFYRCYWNQSSYSLMLIHQAPSNSIRKYPLWMRLMMCWFLVLDKWLLHLLVTFYGNHLFMRLVFNSLHTFFFVYFRITHSSGLPAKETKKVGYFF